MPQGLLRSHSTKVGVWGVIHVSQGKLAYRITDAGDRATSKF